MKRLLAVMLLLLVPGVAHAFDPNRRAEPGQIRIAILSAELHASAEESMIRTKVVRYLTDELRERGFDAYQTSWTYEDAARVDDVDADYFVEVIGANASSADVAGVGIGSRHADVTLGVVVSDVAAELRVYDARTMEPVLSEQLHERSSAVMPTSIGFGGHDMFAWIALPFVHRAQSRSAARAAAENAATIVAEAVR